MRLCRRVVLAALILGIPASATSREVVLEPIPRGTPVLGSALAAADPGDVIRLRKGVYRETVVITKEIALIGEEGAVLDPSEPLQLDWKPAPGVGQGVYRAGAGRRPRVLCLGGKIVAEIDERRRETRDERSPWYWKTLLAKGPRLGGFQYIRAVWIYRGDEKVLYVHLADDA